MLNRIVLPALLLLSFALEVAPAAGQTITIENGANIQLENGGVWNLEGSLVDLGAEASAVPATAGPMGSSAGSWGLALLLGLGGLAGGILWRRRL